jgi:hypothetical protein
MKHSAMDLISGGAILVAVVSIAGAACIEPKMDCSFSGGAFCQGATTACEKGWQDASTGFTCISKQKQEGMCRIYTDCAPHPCSHPPGGHHTWCKGDSQCCSCDTGGQQWGSGMQY